MTNPPLLTVDRLVVSYQGAAGPMRAVDNVSLALGRGATVGLVGESGSGKSTFALALMRLLPRHGWIESGTATLGDTDLLAMTDEEFRRAIRWRAMSMVFQSAMNSLNPVMRVGRLLLEAIQFHDRSLSRSEAGERVSELFVAVGLRKEDLRRYPHEMSGGMRQRAVIALSLVASPQIVIADEATTALDVLIQDQILLTLLELREKRGLSLLVVSHDIDVIAKVCDEVLVMYAGRIVEQGPTADVLRNPAHPYTAGLLAALPTLRGRKRRLPALSRRANHPAGDARGCRFAPLCSLAEDICWSIEPELPDTKRAARCHFAGDSRIRDAFADDVS